MKQKHLNDKDTINLGSYYTPKKYIEKCYQYLMEEIENINDFYILDSSCGYGNFLNFPSVHHKKRIGSDIDEKALFVAQKNNLDSQYFHLNSLSNMSRLNYKLSEIDKLIIIGNPPYNDRTSMIGKSIKKDRIKIDIEIRTRDLGMSFLLSYEKLKANYVCILHPLSYLIKKTNFRTLKNFFRNYKLIRSLIFNSQEFKNTSKRTGFPIIIAFYKRDNKGMNYEFIETYRFKTIENKIFSLKDYEYIDHYINKYPNKNCQNLHETIAYFWTMRDINALKRSRTFVEKQSSNTIHVNQKKLHYYCYVDIFKKFISKIPYYFGNSNIMIDLEKYQSIKDDFTKYSMMTNSVLNKKYKIEPFPIQLSERKIESYFKDLLKEHYVH